MENALHFLRWWKAQREANTAVYPDPKDLTKPRHSKAYDAFLAELSVRWPKARKGLFTLLKQPRSDLAALIRKAAKEASEWWKSTVMKSFVADSIDLAKKIRLDCANMEFVMRNPTDRHGAFGSYSRDFFDCFDKDGGEKLLSPGAELGGGLNSWLEECLGWFERLAHSPLAIPPLVLTQKPNPPWGQVLDPGMQCTTRSPLSSITICGEFTTPVGPKSHDDAYWNNPRSVGSLPIYECIFGYVSHFLFEQRPKSLVQAAKAASVNVWCAATALDSLMEVSEWTEESTAHDWFAQVETAFSTWLKTGLGSLLEFKQAPGAPPNTGTFLPEPRAEHFWHDAFPFGKPSQTSVSSKATICGFILDSILNFCLEQVEEDELMMSKAVGAKRQRGREGQLMAIVQANPNWGKAKVAKHMGIQRYELSRGKLKVAWDGATAMNRQIRAKGFKSNGSIEAVSGEEE